MPEPCFFCHRDDKLSWTRMTFGGIVHPVCDDCREKGEERYTAEDLLTIYNQSEDPE